MEFGSSYYSRAIIPPSVPFIHTPLLSGYRMRPFARQLCNTCGIIPIRSDSSGRQMILADYGGYISDFSAKCHKQYDNNLWALNNAYIMSRGLISGLKPNNINSTSIVQIAYKQGSENKTTDVRVTKGIMARDSSGGYHYVSMVFSPDLFVDFASWFEAMKQKMTTPNIYGDIFPKSVIYVPIVNIISQLGSITNEVQKVIINGKPISDRLLSIMKNEEFRDQLQGFRSALIGEPTTFTTPSASSTSPPPSASSTSTPPSASSTSSSYTSPELKEPSVVGQYLSEPGIYGRKIVRGGRKRHRKSRRKGHRKTKH